LNWSNEVVVLVWRTISVKVCAVNAVARGVAHPTSLEALTVPLAAARLLAAASFCDNL
jgi:hypothetical protein